MNPYRLGRMNPYRERAREHFPSVLLGVLGIIQALALELLWEHAIGGIGRWQALGAGLAGWLQVGSIFLGVVVVWVMYATLVLRYSWVPRFFDLCFPFVLGVLEFLLVELTAPDRIAAYFALLALVFVVASGTTFSIYRTMFEAGDAPRVSLRRQLVGYVPAGAAAVTLLACAAVAGATGPASTATLVCLLAANAGLLGQLATFRHFWQADLTRQDAPRR
jgi:hypothetical protein